MIDDLLAPTSAAVSVADFTSPLFWSFGNLTAAALVTQLQKFLSAQDSRLPWQLIWLNNDGAPVIGMLPKVSWSLYFSGQKTGDGKAIYHLNTICRDSSPTSQTSTMTYDAWQQLLIDYANKFKPSNQAYEINNNSDYHHGLMGFIGYDIAANELSPTAPIQQAKNQPCAFLGHYDIYFKPYQKNDEKLWQLVIHQSKSEWSKDSNINKLIDYLNAFNEKIASNLTTTNQPLPLNLQAAWQIADYQTAFEKTQDYLLNGDCYQINLTQAWRSEPLFESTALIDYLPMLDAKTQAPFAGYLALPYFQNGALENRNGNPLGFELLSCSPELFFTFNRNNHHLTITTKPIKGTVPRGRDAFEDEQFKAKLQDSEKDRSENVMIVDLLRNDLGKYAQIGSVKVPKLFAIESFSNVHHLVSTITATLKSDVHPLSVLFGSLPAGSITGTPKKRAVEIISSLESEARGAYCGTMGFMNFDGSGQWNVLIRTLQANIDDNGQKQISVWAGGGITVASNCDDEYQECLDKVGNVLTVLSQSK